MAEWIASKKVGSWSGGRADRGLEMPTNAETQGWNSTWIQGSRILLNRRCSELMRTSRQCWRDLMILWGKRIESRGAIKITRQSYQSGMFDSLLGSSPVPNLHSPCLALTLSLVNIWLHFHLKQVYCAGAMIVCHYWTRLTWRSDVDYRSPVPRPLVRRTLFLFWFVASCLLPFHMPI